MLSQLGEYMTLCRREDGIAGLSFICSSWAGSSVTTSSVLYLFIPGYAFGSDSQLKDTASVPLLAGTAFTKYIKIMEKECRILMLVIGQHGGAT